MANEKIKELNQIKEDLFALYPNAIKISLTVEGDKIVVTPTEKYTALIDDMDEE